MPIYEYRCADCKRRVSVFFRTFSVATDPQCPNCGGKKLARLVSRVATVKSEESRLEAMSDPSSFGDVDENDPKSVARWMRKMGKEMGEDVAGEDFDQMMNEVESGEGDGGEGDLGGDE